MKPIAYLMRHIVAIYVLAVGLWFVPNLYQTSTVTTPSHQDVSRDDKGNLIITQTAIFVTHTRQSTFSVYLLCLPAGIALLTQRRKAYLFARATLFVVGGVCTVAGIAVLVGFTAFSLGPIRLSPVWHGLAAWLLPVSLLVCALLQRGEQNHVSRTESVPA